MRRVARTLDTGLGGLGKGEFAGGDGGGDGIGDELGDRVSHERRSLSKPHVGWAERIA